ncbi:MAG TPA: cytochrome c [Candidatus Dormibacteraeota bacterium]|nr:cytochrome c [Candidatus Dormibacteraeota bacterium]
MRSWSGLLVHVTVVGALVASAAAARAAHDDPALAQGQKLYVEYCASCHDADGKGSNKPEAKGSDLTQIAKHNGGKFPHYDVMLTISGRKPSGQDQDTSLPGTTKPHGDGKMPSWGQIFAKQEGSEATALDLQLQTTGKIMLITEYLQSIQAK